MRCGCGCSSLTVTLEIVAWISFIRFSIRFVSDAFLLGWYADSDSGGLDLELWLLASEPDDSLDEVDSVGVWYRPAAL